MNPELEFKNVLVIAPKTVKQTCFLFRGMQDLQNLIRFVGKPPRITENMTLIFNRHEVKPNCAVVVNDFSEVIKVIFEKELKENYDLISSVHFGKEHYNPQVVKIRVPKEKKEQK